MAVLRGRSRPGGSTASSRPFRYAHADHHAAAFKTTGTPTIILGNDGGLNISTDNGATLQQRQEQRPGDASLLHGGRATPAFPSLVIGGTQDNGTRLRTDNGTTYNQVIGGDGMGTGRTARRTRTRDRQLPGLRHPDELQQQRRRTRSRTGLPRGAALTRRGRRLLYLRRPAAAGLDATGACSSTSRVARVAHATTAA